MICVTLCAPWWSVREWPRSRLRMDARDCASSTSTGRSLLILDIGLPELDGWQVLERVRELGDVPVLILTAASDELDKVRGLRQGADDYVTKPFGRQELIARVEALLRRAGNSEVGDEVHADGLRGDRLHPAAGLDRRSRSSSSPPRSSASCGPRPAPEPGAEPRPAPGDGLGLRQPLPPAGQALHRLSAAQAGGSCDHDPIETVRGFGYRYRPTPAD